MRIQDCLKNEALKTFMKRKNFLSREVYLLGKHIELLETIDEKNDKTLWTAVYESAATRAVKLVRNSGYTFATLRSFIKQKTHKEYRVFVYPLIDNLHKKEDLLKNEIEALKHFRDRVVVHLDPRFVFNKERLKDNFIDIDTLKKVNDFLQHMSLLLFEKEIKI